MSRTDRRWNLAAARRLRVQAEELFVFRIPHGHPLDAAMHRIVLGWHKIERRWEKQQA